MDKKSAAIIGGGITGLSLAYFLLRRGIQPTVFEKESRLGGLASTFQVENTRLERFYHHFFAQDSLAVGILAELGIRDRFYWAYPKMGFFYRGKVHPFTTPLDLLGFKPLSFIDRVKFGLFSLRAKKEIDWRPLEKIGSEEWLTEKLGREIYEIIWEPMLRAKFGEHASKVPASWVWARLRARGRSRGRLAVRERLGYIKGGYQALIDALEGKITDMGGKIMLGAEARAFPVPGFDLSVITAPNAHHVPGIEYLGNICVVLKLKQKLSDFYWVNIADPEIPFCAMVEHTNAFDDPALNGHKVVYLSNYLDQEDELWEMSDEEIFERCAEGLERVGARFSGREVVEYSVFRERYAQPLPTLGHSGRIPPFRIKDGLYLVSNVQIYPEDRGVNNSIELAQRFVKTLS